MKIVNVTSGRELQAVRALLEEYWESFGFPPSLQNFASEIVRLPGDYAPPAGRLALALAGDEQAGCIALRRLDAQRCEAKRLYVREKFRGQGAGRALLEWLVNEARQAGYSEMCGDTLPTMAGALALYQRMGFERTGPYAANPTPGAIFLRLNLGQGNEKEMAK
jgi:GNAT superfamily N-acetyltransferase